MKLLDEAIERDAYNWFLAHPAGLDYLNGITQAIGEGKSPQEFVITLPRASVPTAAGLRSEQSKPRGTY